MAAQHLKLISLLCLIFSLSSFHAAEGRDSQFFSKEVRSNTPNENPKENPETTTPSTVKPEDVQSTPDTDTNNGYGLYGREASTGEFSSDNHYQTGFNTENEETFSANEGDTTEWYPAKELDNNAEFTQRYPTKEYETDEPTNRYDFNRYASKEYDDELMSNKGAYKEREPSNKYAPKKYDDQLRSNKGYQAEREHYGMSDTRFLEKGKYFYDVHNKGRPHGYSGKTVTEGGYYRGAGRENGYYNNYKRGGYENEDPQEEPEEEYVP